MASPREAPRRPRRITALDVVGIVFGVAIALLFIYLGLDILSKGLDKPSEWLITRPFVVLGRETLVAVGGVAFAITVALFFAELYGYTPTLRGFRKFKLRWDAIDISSAALAAAVYGGSLIATGGIPVIPGFTWVRPGNALAPLFGVLFGLPGSIGVAIGNFLADAFAGYLSVGSIGGFFGNFALAYIPYKLMRDQTFRSGRSIIEFYVYAVLISNVVCSLVISFWLDIMEPVVGLPRPLVWGWFAPFVVFNNAFITSIVSPILGLILYPAIKSRGLHWTDRIEWVE